MRTSIPLALALLALPAYAGGKEWAKGVPYTTDFKDAIKQARTTGRIIMIYNGWEKEGV